MGNQPSTSEIHDSKEAATQASVTQSTTVNPKSILKGAAIAKTNMSASVFNKDPVPEHKRRISRRASVAPPPLNEADLNAMLKEATLAENSGEELNNSMKNITAANDAAAPDTSANIDVIKDPIVDDVALAKEMESKDPETTEPSVPVTEDFTNEILPTPAQEVTSSKEALIWAPVLALSETAPNTTGLMMESKQRKEETDIVSKLKKKATSFFKRDVEDISVDAIIKNLLGHRGTKVQRRAIDIPKSHIEWICRSCLEVVMNQSILLEITGPVNVCGDVHGQYDDLIRIFEMCGYPPNANYLFLGDYVDRGKQSLETILLLMCFKIKYPENFFILRGNHECASVNKVYGFFDECKRRTNVKVWKTFTNFFNCLPIAALISDKIFCVHGGLSPELRHFDQIRNLPRPCDVPSSGLLNDLLWSDPSDVIEDWAENDRGVSYYFGKSAVNSFLDNFSMDLVCRAHMVVEDGYEFFNDRRLVTVFSAPNYCGEFDNKGAIMTVDEKLMCSFKILEPMYPNTVLPLMRESTILPPSNYEI